MVSLFPKESPLRPRAEWRPLSQDVRLRLRHEGRRWGEVAAIFALSFFVFDRVDLEGFLIFIAAGCLWYPTCGRGAQTESSDPSPELVAHATLPLGPDSFPVRVTYRRHFEAVAHDEAIAAFADGWLYVDGVRARFGLRLDDAHVSFPAFAVIAFDFPGGERLELKAFESMRMGLVTQLSLADRFDEAIRAWAGARTVRPASRPSPLPRFPGRLPLSGPLVAFVAGLLLVLLAGNEIGQKDVVATDMAVVASVLGIGLGLIASGVTKSKRYLRYFRSLPRELRKRLFSVEAD